MKLESPAFEHEGVIPTKYTCDGGPPAGGISPPLKISGVPEGTKTLFLNMDDPDVPKSIRPDGLWNHWLVWDIPPETTEIPEGEEPKGVIGKNTGGKFGYGGPCPPDREHRYWFELFALGAPLNLPPEATKQEIEDALVDANVLAKAELMGRYNRKQNLESRS